ncbi:glucose-6-phosphate isomerase [Sulfurospirillum sp. hDNRA2]|uniref:glucose-6-phosphate isomerase n=1 Tax=Sulfurospirillum sp. hDNRA2 TaxID=3237298 RepID=UPI0020B699B7|nr:glucose-6-phosphate isomerase [Sulfurospirillum sp. DNRA8]MCP3651297.1 glucose-6-phosphate isomerase [Sulfurospirillum sp. DNRA8]MCR1810144.1 glucose-6-phosphate isomerase [Sulfurospirillum sp. DNRA8]
MKNSLYFNIKVEEGIFEKIVEEQKNIGYYTLPEQDISYLEAYLEEFRSKNDDNAIKDIAIIGIGGSSLGPKAIFRVLQGIRDFDKRLHFFESTDPASIRSTLNKLDIKNTHFFVISKSGSTIETISVYKYVLSLLKAKEISLDYRFTFVTDVGSKLEAHAKSLKAFVLHIPINVGGRYSVLSAAGLAPLLLAGVDVQRLLDGAKAIKQSFFEDGYIKETLLKKATYYAKNSMNYNINTLFAYSESLDYFTDWYVQLWGESLGKKQRNSSFNVGLTPVGLIGPKDQHSFLQLIVEGLRDKSVTVLKVENFDDKIKIPSITLKELEDLDLMNGIAFCDLINMQADSTIEALLDKKDIPVDTITMQHIDEENMGKLIFYYELLTSIVGQMMDVNAYDQPGVEDGKRILKGKLIEEKRLKKIR